LDYPFFIEALIRRVTKLYPRSTSQRKHDKVNIK
jgi:hypothetical protein